MSIGSTLALDAGVTLGLMVALWALSVAVKDTSIVDIFWGTGFVIVAWVAYAAGDGGGPRRTLLAVLVSIWGLRLTAHLARRNLGKGEDPRYTAMRRKHGDAWPLRSLWNVFLLQGVLLWIVSLPVQAGVVCLDRPHLIWLDYVGAAVWLVGLFFETVGDEQLVRFKADPANKGQVMNRGLWKYTRHPNYFGDFSVWWGLYLIAIATGSLWWTTVGPLVMSVLLIRVSGAALLEKGLSKRKPGYADYIERTSSFFPRPPKRRPPPD